MKRIDLVKSLNATCSTLHWIAFAWLVVVALILRIYAFQGYSGSDPRAYTVLANDLAHGILHFPTYEGPPVFPLRLGVYGPPAILIKGFGLSEITLTIYPFIVSIAGCLLAYILARAFWGPLAGLISISILAILPIDISMSSVLYPDAIAAFWANLGVIFAYFGLSRYPLSYSMIYLLLSGISFGISWLCKETVVYLIPFVIILTLVLHKQNPFRLRVMSLVFVVLASIIVLFAEMLFFKMFTGDALFHLHATERNYEENAVWFFDQTSPHMGWQEGGYVKALIKRLFITGPRDLLIPYAFNLLPVFAVLAIAWSVVFRQGSFSISSTWLITLLMMFNFMTSSFQSYKPLPLFGRYLYPIVFPAALLVAGLFTTLLTSTYKSTVYKERAFWACALIVTYCGLSFHNRSYFMSRPEMIARIVASKLSESDVVYTDFATATSLVFFRTGRLSAYTFATIPYEDVKLTDIKVDSYVLINKNKIDFLRKSYEYEPPSFVEMPPQTWKKVWSDVNAALYQVTD